MACRLRGYLALAPFLLLSIPSGALGDRFDTRRIIQVGMLVFASVSLAWGVLFLTGKLQMWHACVLLIVHGMAGVLWNPATQLLLYDMVGPAQLPSAVRLVATARNLGMLAGPAVGTALLHLGPSTGIFINALIYLPMILWLWKAPYGPRFRKEDVRTRPADQGNCGYRRYAAHGRFQQHAVVDDAACRRRFADSSAMRIRLRCPSSRTISGTARRTTCTRC